MAALEINALALTADQTIGLVCGWNSRDRSACCHIQLDDHASALLDRARELGLQCTLVMLSPDAPERVDWDTAKLLGVRTFNAPASSLRSLLAGRAGFAREPARTLLVSADRTLRSEALDAGMRAVPHPFQAAQMLAGARIRFCEVLGPRRRIQSLIGLMPYDVEDLSDGRIRVIGTLPEDGFGPAAAAGITIMSLDADPERHDLLWMRGDRCENTVLRNPGAWRLIQADVGRHLFAVGGQDEDVGGFLSAGRGQCRLLMPNPSLLAACEPANHEPVALSDTHARLRDAAGSLGASSGAAPLSRDALTELELRAPRWPVSDSEFQAIIDRYRGAAPLDAAGPIRSREVHHPDNRRTVSALRTELAAMGYCVWTHAFAFGGRTLYNVIAEMPGRGPLVLRSEVTERLRRILLQHPQADPIERWLEPIAEILGRDWLRRLQGEGCSARKLRSLVLRELGLLDHPFKFCPAAGVGAGVVFVGTKLDSMATLSCDEGPTIDDNAAGIAATLAIARYLRRFSGELTHTIRLCFFNAEEPGLVGSQLYAANLKAAGAVVRGVFCLDMVGNQGDGRGRSDPISCDPSALVAERFDGGTLAEQALNIREGEHRQWGCAGSAPDQSPFRLHGYPAIAVSESAFALPTSNPPRWPGQSFHRPSDNWIDVSYANDIARAVAQATKELAV